MSNDPGIAAGAKVEIYTRSQCSYCVLAKRLLERKGVTFVEYNIDGDDRARENMLARSGGRRTFPQILINDQAVGGYMELYHLNIAGTLDRLLAGKP